MAADMLLAICAAYSAFIVMALVGNVYVLSKLWRVLRCGRFTNTYVYLVALSLTDLSYALFAITSVYQLHFRTYVFGYLGCLASFVSEGMNKTFAIYLLVIMSADRYLAVCHPFRYVSVRRVSSALRIVLVAAVPVVVSNVPLYVSTTTVRPNNETVFCYLDFGKAAVLANRWLTNDLDYKTIRQTYTKFLFIAYFVIPASLIVFFYASIITVVVRQQRKMAGRPHARRQNKRMVHVACKVGSVVAFYFVCWTPYWLTQILIVHGVRWWSNMSMLVIHLLPLVNSAVNPIFYAYLNRSLTDDYNATQKLKRRPRARHIDNNKECMSLLEDVTPSAKDSSFLTWLLALVTDRKPQTAGSQSPAVESAEAEDIV